VATVICHPMDWLRGLAEVTVHLWLLAPVVNWGYPAGGIVFFPGAGNKVQVPHSTPLSLHPSLSEERELSFASSDEEGEWEGVRYPRARVEGDACREGLESVLSECL